MRYKTASGNHCCNAPLEALVQSGSFGVLRQTKSTFTQFSLKNAFSSVLPQRPALKTLSTQRLHDFGKPPQPLCLHPLQKRTPPKLQKARSRDVKTLLPNMFAKQQRCYCHITLLLYSTLLLFVKNEKSSRARHLAQHDCHILSAFLLCAIKRSAWPPAHAPLLPKDQNNVQQLQDSCRLQAFSSLLFQLLPLPYYLRKLQ